MKPSAIMFHFVKLWLLHDEDDEDGDDGGWFDFDWFGFGFDFEFDAFDCLPLLLAVTISELNWTANKIPNKKNTTNFILGYSVKILNIYLIYNHFENEICTKRLFCI